MAIDRTNLTPEQKAKLAYALAFIKASGDLKGWTLYRVPSVGIPTTLTLRKHVNGKMVQVWYLQQPA